MEVLDHVCWILLLCLVTHFYMIIMENFRGFFLMDPITCLVQFNMESNLGQVFKVLGLFVLFAIGLQFMSINGYFVGFVDFLYNVKNKSGFFSKGFCSKSDLDVKSSVLSKGFCSKSDLDVKSSVLSKGFCSKSDLDVKSGVLSKGFCSKSDLNVKSSSKIGYFMYTLLDGSHETKDNGIMAKTCEDAKVYESNSDNDFGGKEWCDEDKEFDVLKLRKMVKIERGRANKACLDLEKERLAAATASEEAMSMILRLQTEKSLIELEAKQYRRLAEEKQLHDQEVINSLQWLLSKNETERGLLGNQSSSCRQTLRVPMQSYDGDHFENGMTPGISSSFDVDSSS
ncbi:hypothetical protein Leryth_011849 [Lithospermum erythrorhizon]|nr:hypothetical protein Leryth_011849 [Lithospermum erythrorhizon]